MLSSLFGVAQVTEAELTRTPLGGAGYVHRGRVVGGTLGVQRRRARVGQVRWAETEVQDQVPVAVGAWAGTGGPGLKIRTRCGEEARGTSWAEMEVEHQVPEGGCCAGA